MTSFNSQIKEEINQTKNQQKQNDDFKTKFLNFSEDQNNFHFIDITSALKSTNRFSKPVLVYISQISTDNKPTTPEYWKNLTKCIRAAVKKSYKTGNALNNYRIELSELTAWTKEMEKAIKKDIQKSVRQLSLHDIEDIETFRAFLKGEANFLSKLLFKGELTIPCQKSIRKRITELINNSNGLEKINHVYTRINKIERCFESIIFQETTITISRSLTGSNTNDHIQKTIELLKENESIIKNMEEDVVEIADIIISLPTTELTKLLQTLQKSMKQISIHLHTVDILGNIVSVKLPKDIMKNIIRIAQKYNADIIKAFRQELVEIFAPKRTFRFTSSDGWFKQAISWHEKLNMLIDIEEALSSGKKVVEIKNIIKTSFENWETLKHSKSATKIGEVHINKWIKTLKQITADNFGYKLRFDFRELKGIPKLRQKKPFFLDRFGSKRAGERHYIPDRWEGVIYDRLGQLEKRDNVLNTFTIRIRKNIAVYCEFLEKSILKRLEKIATRDLRNLSKLFENQKFLENIWVKAGHKTPNVILKNLVNETNNPLNILHKIEVQIDVIDGKALLKDLFDENQSIRKTDFIEHFNNRNIIEKAMTSDKIITEKILKGKVFNFLSNKTVKEVPIPRFSKSKGVVYASITNENERAAAVRVFLDLITRSEEGIRILLKTGMISKKTHKATKSPKEKVKIGINWKTGVSTQKIDGQISGLLDGIVSIKIGNKYEDEFIVEMVGTRKGQLPSDYARAPFSTVIGDILRIACFRAMNKPGMVVYTHYDNLGNLKYTIIYFQNHIGELLRKKGAHIAVDINRPLVRNLIQRDKRQIIDKMNKNFNIQLDIQYNIDLNKYLSKDSSLEQIYSEFYKIVNIIIGRDKK